jgi:hypothetical protein
MDAQESHPDESRPATVADLVQVCRSLNVEGARYVVVGGFAVNQHGFARVTTDDLSAYAVIRVADEIVVDLMSSACGVRFDDSASEIETHVVDGVPIPFASASLLLRTKQTHRDKDGQDRLYLEHRVAEQKRRTQ